MLTETVNIHVYNIYLISHLPLNFFENVVNQNVATRRIKKTLFRGKSLSYLA